MAHHRCKCRFKRQIMGITDRSSLKLCRLLVLLKDIDRQCLSSRLDSGIILLSLNNHSNLNRLPYTRISNSNNKPITLSKILSNNKALDQE